MPRPPSRGTLDELRAAVGPGSWFDSPVDLAPYVVDFRRQFRGATPLMLEPRTTGEVSKILAICHRDEVAVVPVGGNTGYCGGATPDDSGTQIVVSMRRLTRLRTLDATNYSMIVEAGITLAAAQAAAHSVGRLFPLSLGSEGTAQIGGNVSTNAGGTAVLRYGMMRDLVLGLEVVMADGRVMSALGSLRKDNTGYDMKSMFVGAEGTLGIITAVSLKLFPSTAAAATALAGIDSPQHALALLARLRCAGGDQVSTFEFMPRRAVELTVKHVAGVANPLSQGADWYLLIELTSSDAKQDLAGSLADELHRAAADGLLKDAMIADSIAQSRAMWKLRESVPEAQRHHGASLKHDVSVPLSFIPELITRGSALVDRWVPEGEVLGYGHVGDGNLHFNVAQRPGTDVAAFLSRGPGIETALFDLVSDLGGSISAEHGIGRLKSAEFEQRADPVEFSLMRDVKRALDPKGIMNPGKVLS